MYFLFLLVMSACSAKQDVASFPRRSSGVRSTPKNTQVFAPAKGKAKCQKDINQLARQHSTSVLACYSKRLAYNPGMRGRLVVALKVSERGSVSESRVTTNSTNDKFLASCVRANALTWGFPKSCPGWISLPFKLEPGRQLPGKKSTIPMPLFNQ